MKIWPHSQSECVPIPSQWKPGQSYVWELTTMEVDEYTFNRAYGLGYGKPNYPVPTIHGPCLIERFIVEIVPADERDRDYTNCKAWHKYK